MPILGVNIAILKHNQVLLTQRKDFEVWCLPGGEVDDGESLAEAAVREAREEVGLNVRLDRLVGIHSRPQWLSSGSHVAVFAARVVGGELTLQPQEVLDAGWFRADELPAKMLLGHQQQVLDALNGVVGAVWTNESEWEFSPGITRQELYHLRDTSGLSPAEFYLQKVARPIPGGQRLEVEGKVDVY